MKRFIVSASDREFCFYRAVRLIPYKLRVFGLKIFKGRKWGCELKRRKGFWFPPELFLNLRSMIFIHMQISKGMDEFSGFSSKHLRHNGGEQCVTRDIERNA